MDRLGRVGGYVAGKCLMFLFAVWVCGQAAASDSAILTWSGNGHQYQFIDTAMDYAAATAYAQSRGAYLLTLTSAEEATWVNQNLVTPYQHYIWLGLIQDTAPHRNAWAADQHWHWATGEPFSFVDWYPPEPNDYPSPAEDNEENYAIIYPVLGQWQDFPPSGTVPVYPIIEFSASVSWAGTPGYTGDGLEPEGGDPDSTMFTFEAQYTDPRGLPPRRAAVVLQRLDCTSWVQDRVLPLTLESGDVATGAIYSAATQLPNEVYRYSFRFSDSGWFSVTGPPTAGWTPGPLLQGPPKLCWSPRQWFRTDGVTPNTGAAGSRFRFEVRYRDSAGDAPIVHRVRLQREGVPYLTRTLTPTPVGNDRTGRNYTILFAIDEPGTYQYRFVFADDDGDATGDPTEWSTGPTVTGGSGAPAQIASLAAVPTVGGAQLTFSLSAAARVTATVLNVAGRPVRTITADEPREAGLQTLTWNRQADTGLAVPSGLYLVRVTARADNGAESTAMATVALR